MHLYPLAFLTISLVVLIVSQDLAFVWVTEIAEAGTAACSCPTPRETADIQNCGVEQSRELHVTSTIVRMPSRASARPVEVKISSATAFTNPEPSLPQANKLENAS